MKKLLALLLSLLFLFSTLGFSLLAQEESLLKDLVFFGDSTTYGLLRYNVQNDGRHGENYRTLMQEQIWVPTGGTFYLKNLLSARLTLANGQALTLKEAVAQEKPRFLVLTVGINGLCSWTQEEFTRWYQKMLDQLREASPETVLLLQSVFPSAEERASEFSAFTNDKIDRVNGWIAAIAAQNQLRFLDTQSVLKNEKGFLRAEYHNGDGLHLNTAGFNRVLWYLENTLKQERVL